MFSQQIVKNGNQLIDGDQLHNLNCYYYLQCIANILNDEIKNKKLDVSDVKLPPSLIFILHIFLSSKFTKYKPHYPYGNLFSIFLKYFEEDLIKKHHLNVRSEDWYKNFVINLYENSNSSLKTIYENISVLVNNKNLSHTEGQVSQAIKNQLKHTTAINQITPQTEGEILKRGMAFITFNWQPQLTTSLPVVKKYKFKGEKDLPIEIRIGTQGQYYYLIARVCPLFEEWLFVKASLQDDKSKVQHIYFNNLRRDSSKSIERSFETKLTHALEALENRHKNIAVITLPADDGLFDKARLKHHQKNVNCHEAKKYMLKIISGLINKPSKNEIIDFHISEKVDKLLYENVNKKKILKELINNSFVVTGCENQTFMSEAEYTTIYFHLIKYELVNFIIGRIKPKSINFSCKDGIDRAGVSSLYYNLLKSIELGTPMSEAEFYEGLHSAAVLVKGRGINHHIKLFWHAINAYVDHKRAKSLDLPEWLIEWCDRNIVTNSKKYFLNQLKNYTMDKNESNNDKKIAGLILESLENQKIIQDYTVDELNTLHNFFLKSINSSLGKMVSDLKINHIIPAEVYLYSVTHKKSENRDKNIFLQQLKDYALGINIFKSKWISLYEEKIPSPTIDEIRIACKIDKNINIKINEFNNSLFSRTEWQILYQMFLFPEKNQFLNYLVLELQENNLLGDIGKYILLNLLNIYKLNLENKLENRCFKYSIFFQENKNYNNHINNKIIITNRFIDLIKDEKGILFSGNEYNIVQSGILRKFFDILVKADSLKIENVSKNEIANKFGCN